MFVGTIAVGLCVIFIDEWLLDPVSNKKKITFQILQQPIRSFLDTGYNIWFSLSVSKKLVVVTWYKMSLRLVACSKNYFFFLVDRWPWAGRTKFNCTSYQKTQTSKAFGWAFQAFLAFIEFFTFHSPHSWHNGKYVKNSAQFSAFLNKQFAHIVYTKRLELHLCERESCVAGVGALRNTLSKIYQKPRLYIHSCEEW
jgi:hypothetical protein